MFELFGQQDWAGAGREPVNEILVVPIYERQINYFD
jgi:hypothetical protein